LWDWKNNIKDIKSKYVSTKKIKTAESRVNFDNKKKERIEKAKEDESRKIKDLEVLQKNLEDTQAELSSKKNEEKTKIINQMRRDITILETSKTEIHNQRNSKIKEIEAQIQEESFVKDKEYKAAINSYGDEITKLNDNLKNQKKLLTKEKEKWKVFNRDENLIRNLEEKITQLSENIITQVGEKEKKKRFNHFITLSIGNQTEGSKRDRGKDAISIS